MTTVYGNWTPNISTNQRMRLRLEYSVPTPTVGQTSVTVTGAVYVEAGYSFYDTSNTFSWSGSLLGSGSLSKSLNVATGGSQQIHTFSKAVTLTNSAQGQTVAFALSGVEYVGASNAASVSAVVSVPARAFTAPTAPTGFTVTRVSDARHDLAWSASPTADKPVERFEVARYRLSSGTTAYAPVSNPLGSARSYQDRTPLPDDEVAWRIRAVNAAGVSAWVYTGYVYTTPTRATSVAVVRTGTDATVSWKVNARKAATQTLQSQDSTDGGASWSAWANTTGHVGFSASTTSRVVTSLDPTRIHRFRVVSTVTTPETLNAYSSASNTLQLLTAPLAPSLFALGTVSSQEPTTLRWAHRPVDTTAQTAAEVDWRLAGTSTWTTVAVSGGTQSTTVAAGGLPVGDVEWRVRTKGQHASYSPYSSIGVFTVQQPPAVSITAPATGGALDTNRLVLTIAYSDPQGAAMTSWRAELSTGGQVIETRAYDGAPSRIGFNTVLDNNTAYSAELWVTAGTGLTSAPATWSGTTMFLLPVPVDVTASWDEPNGTAQLAAEVAGLESINDWTGTPHASTSTETVGGTLARTNWITNPSFETADTIAFAGSGIASAVRVGGPTSGFEILPSGTWRLRVTGTTPATPSASITPAGEAPVVPGQWVAFSARVNKGDLLDTNVAVQLQWRSGATQVGYSNYEWFDLGVSSLSHDSTLVWAVAEVPAGVDNARPVMRFTSAMSGSVTAPPDGFKVNIDALMLTVGATMFESALAAGISKSTTGGHRYTQISQDLGADGWVTLAAPTDVRDRADVPLLIYCHGSGGGHDSFSSLRAWSAMRDWLVANGWAWVEGTGGGVDSWANQAARDAYLAYHQFATDHLDVGPVVVLGRSMGGLIASWLTTRSPIANDIAGLIMNSAVSTMFVGDEPGTGTLVTRSSGAYFSQLSTAYGVTVGAPNWYTDIQAAAADHAPENWGAGVWAGKRVLHLYGTEDTSVPWFPRGGAYMRDMWAGRLAVDLVDVKIGGDHSGSNGSYDRVDAMGSFLWDIVDTRTYIPGAQLGYFDGDTPDTVAPVAIRFERSDDGGQTWQVVADELPLGAGMGDDRVPLNIDAQYRAVAVSAVGTERDGEATVLRTPSSRVWLQSDAGKLWALWNVQLAPTFSHEQVTARYIGRDYPTVHYGRGKSERVSVSGVWVDDDERAQDPRVALDGPVWYRDPVSRAWWATVSDIATPQPRSRRTDVSFTVERIEDPRG